MRKICLTLLVVLTSFTAFGADKISVTINGQTYACSDSQNATAPEVVSIYCECSEVMGIFFRRVAIMSDGSTKIVSSTQLTPSNGSYNPKEVREKCDQMVRQCNR